MSIDDKPTPRDTFDAIRHLAELAMMDEDEQADPDSDAPEWWEFMSDIAANADDDHDLPGIAFDNDITDTERARGYIRCAVRLLQLAGADLGDQRGPIGDALTELDRDGWPE